MNNEAIEFLGDAAQQLAVGEKIRIFSTRKDGRSPAMMAIMGAAFALGVGPAAAQAAEGASGTSAVEVIQSTSNGVREADRAWQNVEYGARAVESVQRYGARGNVGGIAYGAAGLLNTAVRMLDGPHGGVSQPIIGPYQRNPPHGASHPVANPTETAPEFKP